GAARRCGLGGLLPHRGAPQAPDRAAAARDLGHGSDRHTGLDVRGVLVGGGRPGGDRRAPPGRAATRAAAELLGAVPVRADRRTPLAAARGGRAAEEAGGAGVVAVVAAGGGLLHRLT